VQNPEGLKERWLLRLARETTLPEGQSGCRALRTDRAHPSAQQGNLRRSSHSLRAENARDPVRQKTGRQVDDARVGSFRMWWSKTCSYYHPQGCCREEHVGKVPDLVKRDFAPQAPDRLWVADITYVRSWEGWLYLSFVLDAFSRKVVGWSMANHLRAEMVLDALNMGLYNRRPAPGLIHHSDRGSQYTSVEFGKRLKGAGLLPSVGSVGDAYDNSMAESFVSTLKRELIHRHSWPTRQSVRVAIFEYIEAFYNTRRRHSALGHLSPSEYEEARMKGEAVA
jgi:transposase InsO family protein